jgi:hypothetical protein
MATPVCQQMAQKWCNDRHAVGGEDAEAYGSVPSFVLIAEMCFSSIYVLWGCPRRALPYLRASQRSRTKAPFARNLKEHPMSTRLPDIGHVTEAQVDGLEIRLARGGRSEGVPVLLTSPWPESIYAFRGILPMIEALGPPIVVDLPGFDVRRQDANADLRPKGGARRATVGMIRQAVI